MSKGAKTTTQTVTPDQQTQDARAAIYGRGQSLANSPEYQRLLQSYSGYAGLAGQGAAAVGGDQAAIAQFMNPFQDQVIRGTEQAYAKAGTQAANMIDDRFTRAGAFGGSRAAVAQGVSAANIASDRSRAIADLRYRGYGDTMNRANVAANLGLAGNADYLKAYGAPAGLFQMAAQNGGQTTATTTPGGSWLGTAVGLGTTLAGIPGAGSFFGMGGGGGGGGESFFKPASFGNNGGSTYGIGR